MTADRLVDLLALMALACVGVMGLGRTLALARRGVWVVPIDRERSFPEGLADLGAVLVMLTFVYGAIRTGTGRPFGPDLLAKRALPWLALRFLGLPVAAAGVVLYVRALRDFGLSWRFTIDRERPGELVTTGVFAFSRNPVYLALSLLALGVALTLGNVCLLLLAAAAPFYFRYLIGREERFLTAHYGERYAEYCARVPRWLRLGRR